ncbi:ABC transporter ATP-binding protein [Cohnella nanjingensis]|uniref:ABC transporter ATP-binding protein n=1 Tax=Cohnella nanjingensis TaxID=1387779 RepID=A0A7X0VK30_9BACL|nr:ABC transporter ATP-binding protein [Cohnella nanjingensis]MBB6675354.1 ABC transporter ATP-binding protein [Cohnella nanjingensis]
MIEVQGVEKNYGSAKVLSDVGFQVNEGAFFGILGPNGSGKSTLLKLISGIEKADAGEVRLGDAGDGSGRAGRLVGEYSRKELAKWLAVLEQEALPPVGFTVREVVEMGRFPFQNWLGEEAEDAGRQIDTILAKLGLQSLEERTIDQLSGGEKQRVALAKAMAQRPRLLLLDEPTTYLDIGRQIQLMDRIREWQREAKLTVVAVLHDLNLAALYCDRLLLLNRGRIVGVGSPQEILTAERISEIYGIEPLVTRHPALGVPQVLLQPHAEERGSGER